MSVTRCPECNEWMDVERVHNGVCYVWHGVHCGYGQAYMADDDVFSEIPSSSEVRHRETTR